MVYVAIQNINLQHLKIVKIQTRIPYTQALLLKLQASASGTSPKERTEQQ